MSLLVPEPTPTVIPAPTQEPLKELSVCLGSEPRSLYAYQAATTSELAVLKSITDGPIDVLSNGETEAILLEFLPTVENGAVRTMPVDVSAGEIVVNSAGDLVTLEAGIEVFPTTCDNSSCAIIWDGTSSLQVDQPIVTFDLKQNLKWSDGEPLTAEDIVFSFNMAADPATPVRKQYIDLTQSYQALDADTVEWTGMPGLVTNAVENFLWAPLPAHALNGFNASELLENEAANRMPLSFGPFKIEEWQAGDFLRLIKNPNYHRADEGLPAADALTFKFLSAADSASLLTAAQAECDIVASAAIGLEDIEYLFANAADTGMQLMQAAPDAVEMLSIGIKPSSYDDNYYPYGSDRPDFFGDVRTRQALAYCIDQQSIIDKLLAGSVDTAHALFPVDHPLLDGVTLSEYNYDPAAGIALLEQVGWQDTDLNPDTPLTAFSIVNIPYGIDFEIDLITSNSELRGEIAAEIAADLSTCGITVNITQLPLADLYQSAPDGPLFGRDFDLALVSLQTGSTFDCRWLSSQEIPTEENYWLGTTTGGANYIGYQNENYDASCAQTLRSGADEVSASAALRDALLTINEEVPVIPIYFHPGALLIREGLCGLPVDFQEPDLFMTIENLALDDCG